MRVNTRVIWFFTPSLTSAASPLASVGLGCGVRRTLPIFRPVTLLEVWEMSGGGVGGASAGVLVGEAVGVGTDSQEFGEGGGVGVGERRVGSFDAAQGRGGDAGGGGEFGLGHSFDDAPVPGVAVFGGDGDYLLDGCFQVSHDAGEQVDLWGTFAGFPVVDRGLGYVGHAGEVADADVAVSAGVGEGLCVESAQDSSCHSWPGWRVIVRQVHRTSLTFVNVGVLLYRLNIEYGVGRTALRGGIR